MNLTRKAAWVRQMTVAADKAIARSVTASPAKMALQRLIWYILSSVYLKLLGLVMLPHRFYAIGLRAAGQRQDDDRSEGPYHRQNQDATECHLVLSRRMAQRAYVLDGQFGDMKCDRALDKAQDEDEEQVAQVVELLDVRLSVSIIGE